MRPYRSAREPHALLPIIPPIVHRVWLDGSGPNRSPAGSCRCSSACTSPGWTVAVMASASTSSTWFMCRLKSSTSPVPTAFPAIEVPAPRAVTGIPASRQTASAASASAASRGRATAAGTTRKAEASDE